MKPKYIWMRPLLGVFFSLCFLGLTVGLTVSVFVVEGGWAAMPGQVQTLYIGLVQALIVMVTTGFGFYFGSSQGSSNKAETLDTLLGNGGKAPDSSKPEGETDKG